MATAVKDTPRGGFRALLRPARQETYEKVFDTVYVGLVTNVLLAIACAPLLVALAVVRDPLTSWPFLVVVSVVCAPALTGAFACFAALGEGSTAVLRAFWGTYRRTAGRALLVWAAGAAAVTVLAVDALVVARTAWGPALVPFFVVAAALVAAVALALLVLLAEPAGPDDDLGDTGPRSPGLHHAAPRGTASRDTGPRDAVLPGTGPRGPGLRDLARLVRPSVYLTARRCHLAALSLGVLGLAVAAVLVKPLIGVLLAASPLLYVAWATTRYLLTPVVLPGPRPPAS
jgi:hypothetical protein